MKKKSKKVLSGVLVAVGFFWIALGLLIPRTSFVHDWGSGTYGPSAPYSDLVTTRGGFGAHAVASIDVETDPTVAIDVYFLTASQNDFLLSYGYVDGYISKTYANQATLDVVIGDIYMVVIPETSTTVDVVVQLRITDWTAFIVLAAIGALLMIGGIILIRKSNFSGSGGATDQNEKEVEQTTNRYICPKCGAESESRFCPDCGEQLK